MGWAFCVGACWCCKQMMAFNPLKVPSYRHKGVREPICRNCVATANVNRQKNGLDPIRYSEDAYEPISEEELPYADFV